MTFNVKYRSIKAFILAARYNSFREAADRLGVTQPSLSALIRDLEEILDVRLFDRTTRKVAITEAGREFLDRVERSIDDIEDAYDAMRGISKVQRQTITMGALPSIAAGLIPIALRKLRQVHPTLKIRLTEAYNDELNAMLLRNQIEFSIGGYTSNENMENLIFEPLAEDTFHVVMPPELAASLEGETRWRHLHAHDLIIFSQGSTWRTQYEKAMQEAELATGSIYEVSNLITAIQMTRNGLGLTVVPGIFLFSLDASGLVVKPLTDNSTKRQIGIYRRKDKELQRSSLKFIEVLKGVVADVFPEKTLRME